MARWGACTLAAALICGANPAPAHAHGGVFVPPPPESGPGGPPGAKPGETPGHVDPGFGGPITTPGRGGLTGGRVGRRKPREITPSFEDTWEFWWELNRPHALPDRRMVRQRWITPGDLTEWNADRAKLATDRVEPLLREILDPQSKYRADVRASACIALGKITSDPGSIDLLLHWMEDESAPGIVRESAALGLGLLRRTDPAQQLQALRIEKVRQRLLYAFDTRAGAEHLRVPERTRIFAMYAIGLLGDQPFQDHVRAKDGRLLSQLIWQRLGNVYPKRSLRIALITALGLQPRAGIPEGVREGLRGIVAGEKVQGRKWDLVERAHALTAVARQGGPAARAMILRVLSNPRTQDELRVSALLAIGTFVEQWGAGERVVLASALARAPKGDESMLVGGLRAIALGRILGADLAGGSTRVLEATQARAVIEQRARKGKWYERGFGLIALALAAHHGGSVGEGIAFRDRAQLYLLDAFRAKTATASARGAAAVALGLMGLPGATTALVPVVRKPDAIGELRGHAALALGQIGIRSKDVFTALDVGLAAAKSPALQGRSALALGLLGRSGVAQRLTDELVETESVSKLAQLTTALGNLGDLEAVNPLCALARRSDVREVVQAMAVVSLGRLVDPELRPSLLRIMLPANYALPNAALREAFTIL